MIIGIASRLSVLGSQFSANVLLLVSIYCSISLIHIFLLVCSVQFEYIELLLEGLCGCSKPTMSIVYRRLTMALPQLVNIKVVWRVAFEMVLILDDLVAKQYELIEEHGERSNRKFGLKTKILVRHYWTGVVKKITLKSWILSEVKWN